LTAATRDDSRSEPEDEPFTVRWNDRAMFGSFRGLPWWAAVAIAFVVAIVGTFVDVSSTGRTVGLVFGVTFFVGCVGAVVFVERRSMFGPIVQPPLILAIVVPLLVMITQGMPSGGLAAVGLKLGKPLIDGFPAMALTTAFTVILGIVRVMTQKDPNRPTKDEIREAKRRPDKPRRADRPDRADRAGRPERAEKPSAEDRPKRPRGGEPERRRPAPPPADEDRPKRPRPPAAGSADRPRRPAPPREGGRPPRRPRPPRDEG
jgi:hypothetical protein